MSRDFDEEPELMDEEALLRPKKKRRQPTEDGEPYYANPEDQLYKVYGLRASLPVRTKVESLHLVYRLPVKDISDLIGVSTNVVRDELENLNDEWKRMGRPLSADERELQRGRYIAELDRTIQQIDDAVANNNGYSRSLSLKINALEKRAKLLGLDLEKHEKTIDEDVEKSMLNEVERMVNELPEDRLAEMMACIEAGQSLSANGPDSSVPSGLANPPGYSGTVDSSSSVPESSCWDDLD